MAIFCQIGQIEEHAEGSRDDAGLSQTQPGDPLVQFGFCLAISAAPSLRELANVLDERERLAPFDLRDDLAQHVA